MLPAGTAMMKANIIKNEINIFFIFLLLSLLILPFKKGMPGDYPGHSPIFINWIRCSRWQPVNPVSSTGYLTANPS
jgi:hypothetical protein